MSTFGAFSRSARGASERAGERDLRGGDSKGLSLLEATRRQWAGAGPLAAPEFVLLSRAPP